MPAHTAYIDGELCAIRPDGTTSFSDLQAATDHKDATRLVYFAFDLLFIDGENLAVLPLIQWKNRLKKLLRRAPKNIYFVDHVIGSGQAFYDATCEHAADAFQIARAASHDHDDVLAEVTAADISRVDVDITHPHLARPSVAIAPRVAGSLLATTALTGCAIKDV